MNEGLQLLPDNWVWVKLVDITEDIQKVDPKLEPNKEFQYLEINSIDNMRQVISEAKNYIGKDAPSRARQLVKTNDILFSTVRTYLKNIAIVDDEFNNQVASTGFCVIRTKQPIFFKFLFYYFQTSQFLNPLNEIQRGTSYPAVRNSDVLEQYVPLPPLAEQGRIVNELERLLTQYDEGIQKIKNTQKLIIQNKKSILTSAFNGKLTRKWRQKEALPEGQLTPLIEMVNIQMGQSPPGSSYNSDGIGIPLINGPTEFGGHHPVPVQWTTKPTKISKIGDILICVRGNTTGRMNWSDKEYCIGRGIASITVKEKIKSEYVYHYLSTLQSVILQKSSGSTFPNISKNDLNELEIYLPSKNEQEIIINEIEYYFSIIETNEVRLNELLLKTNNVKQSILKSTFIGKLIPQNHSDEPANILLERIKRAKNNMTLTKRG